MCEMQNLLRVYAFDFDVWENQIKNSFVDLDTVELLQHQHMMMMMMIGIDVNKQRILMHEKIGQLQVQQFAI